MSEASEFARGRNDTAHGGTGPYAVITWTMDKKPYRHNHEDPLDALLTAIDYLKRPCGQEFEGVWPGFRSSSNTLPPGRDLWTPASLHYARWRHLADKPARRTGLLRILRYQ